VCTVLLAPHSFNENPSEKSLVLSEKKARARDPNRIIRVAELKKHNAKNKIPGDDRKMEDRVSDVPGKYAFQAMGMTTSGNVGENLWLFIKKVSTIAYEHSNYEVDERLFAQTWLTRLSCCAAQQNAQHAIRRATKLHDMFVDPGGGRREAAERLRSCGEHVDGPLVARYPVMVACRCFDHLGVPGRHASAVRYPRASDGHR
jgi:hypothetical protein